MAKIKPGSRGASSTPASPVQEDDGEDQGRESMGREELDAERFQRAAIATYHAAIMQTEIEMPEKAGMPSRVRSIKYAAEHARDIGNTTFVVRVDEAQELFEWVGYPMDERRVRGDG